MKTLEEKRAISQWFDDSANWFALFVRSGEEQRVLKYLSSCLDSDIYFPFIPTRDFAFNKGRRNIEIQKKLWMSGYVFIATTQNKEEFIEILLPIAKQHIWIYKILSNSAGSYDVLLSDHDKSIMFTLLDENFNIPAIAAVKVGSEVRLMDDLFIGKVGKVIRIDVHKRYAIIEMELFNSIVSCEIMLNLLHEVL